MTTATPRTLPADPTILAYGDRLGYTFCPACCGKGAGRDPLDALRRNELLDGSTVCDGCRADLTPLD